MHTNIIGYDPDMHHFTQVEEKDTTRIVLDTSTSMRKIRFGTNNPVKSQILARREERKETLKEESGMVSKD